MNDKEIKQYVDAWLVENKKYLNEKEIIQLPLDLKLIDQAFGIESQHEMAIAIECWVTGYKRAIVRNE